MCKIAFVCQDLIGQGVQFATATMVRAFFDHGFEVELLLSRVHQDLINAGQNPFSIPNGVKCLLMPSRRSSRNGGFLRDYLQNGKADIVVAETRHYAWALSYASTGLSTIPRLYQVEHINVPQTPKCFLQRLKLKTVRYFCYRRFSGVMTVNEESARRLKEQTSLLAKRLKIETVYNAVVDRDFETKRSCETRHPWLRVKECPTFVAAGALHEGKCFSMLLNAVRLVSRKSHVRLVVFGRGALEGEFRDFVVKFHLEDVISIAGYTDNLPAELKSADGFISSSRAESFSIVLAQALALGVPCISTDAPLGPREVLANGKYGKLVAVDDVNAMAEAILDFVENPPEKPKAESWRRFTIEAVYNRYLNAMEFPSTRS